MSWDVKLFTQSFDLTPDKAPPPFGTKDMTRQKIRLAIAPLTLDAHDTIHDPQEDLNIHVTLGNREPVESVLLSIHGTGDATAFLKRLCTALGCAAQDVATTEFIDFNGHSPDRYWNNFVQFRDQVLDAHDMGEDF